MKTSTLIVTTCVIAALTVAVPVAAASPSSSALPDKGADLSLNDALRLALEYSPQLAAADAASNAASQRARYAGLWPNPELEVEAENFAGPGELSGFDSAEFTGLISQEFLLGGKLSRRREVAEADSNLAARDLEVANLDLRAVVASRFYDLLMAQERAAVAKDLMALAESSFAAVSRRVEAGKVPPVDATRARIQVAAVRSVIEAADRDVQARKAILAATWGRATPSFARAVGPLPRALPPPPLERLAETIEDLPELRRMQDEVRRREAESKAQHALAVPDLTVSVGPRRQRDTDQTSWVAGFSLPLPIFDRNQGERRAADFEVQAALRDAEAARAEIEASVTATAHRLAALAAQVETLEDELVPAANEVFQATQIGYREGKLGLLQVLDSQRTIAEVEQQRLDALHAYLETRILLERLLGRSLEEITTQNHLPAATGVEE